MESMSGSPEASIRERLRYETLRSLLDKNGRALQLLSDLEADLSHFLPWDHHVRGLLHRLGEEILLMAQEVNILSGGRHVDLYPPILRIGAEIEALMQAAPQRTGIPLAVRLGDDLATDPSVAGGKTAGVALLARLFPDAVPPGFAVTTRAYRSFLEERQLVERIRLLLSDIDFVVGRDLFRARTHALRDLIRSAPVPPEVEQSILRHATELSKDCGETGWAVRSSAIAEDGRHTFAGQFDSWLCVAPGDLVQAYKSVLASRFTDRAVIYRLHCGFSEVETPMAVLFMPMVDPAAAGVIYTIDPQDPDAARMIVRSVPGLGDAVVRGAAEADVLVLSREDRPRVLESRSSASGARVSYLSEDAISEIGAMTLRAAERFGHEMDVEWAVDKQGKLWLLQGRRLNVFPPDTIRERKTKKTLPLLEGGTSIFPGRSEGDLHWMTAGVDPATVPAGCVLAVNQPAPELAAALPRVAAILAAGGSPVGHLATLVREFAVPAVFGLGDRIRRLVPPVVVSVDATNRRIYEGSRWPGIRERVLNRMASAEARPRSGPLHELVTAFHLTDPYSPTFKARNCRSIHDAIRFMHETAVMSMFGFGDEHSRLLSRRRNSRPLHTSLPMRIRVIDLDGSIPSSSKRIAPDQVASIPFQAFWRGITDSRLPWPQRWDDAFPSLPGDFREAVLSGGKSRRRPKAANYAMIASDYLNLNARLAYHYAMVDAIIGPGDHVNHVHFRLQGGGASDANRVRRARFLEEVLRLTQFGVDRQADLIAAWLRGYPRRDTEHGLELLAKLMVCARQLDLLMRSDDDVHMFAELFLNGEYGAFA